MSSDKNVTARAEQGLFEATRWSVVLRARDKSEAALGTLCENYRRPLLVWLQKEQPRMSREDIEDLIQGYFGHLLSRDFLANVAKEKGTFRSFLLGCLKNYIRDQFDKNKAAKRGGGTTLESLDETHEDGQTMHDPASPVPAPDLDYDLAWKQTVLANALKRLETECARTGHVALCSELEPVMHGDDTASSYAEIAGRLGMTTGAVTTAAHRIRARLSGLIREEVLQTVASETELQSELRYLLELSAR